MFFKTEPYKHQREALEKSYDKKCFALFMEQGTGKSKVAIDTMVNLYLEGKIDRAVVITNKGVYRNWHTDEIPIHCGVEYESYLWTSDKTQKAAKELARFKKLQGKLKVFITNVEAYSSKAIHHHVDEFMSRGNCLAIIDESTSIKNHKAIRTKTINKLFVHCAYKRILTGTPLTKSPLDLFSQFAFLSPQILGFGSFFAFRNTYGIVVDKRLSNGRVFKDVVGYRNLEDLKKKIEWCSFRVLKKECLDLPDKVYLRREVELTKEQKEAYKGMKSFLRAELEDKDIIVTTDIAKILRLHQIVCGFIGDESGEIVTFKHNRLTELENIVEETDGKIIIWAKYIHNIKEIEKFLKEKYGETSCVTYYGGTPKEHRSIAVQNFKTYDSCRFFISNKTGAYGLTLNEANTVIYYSNDYDLEVRQQSEDRCHRIGQTNKVTYIDLVCPGTIDEEILRSLREKKKLQDLLGLGEKLKQVLR